MHSPDRRRSAAPARHLRHVRRRAPRWSSRAWTSPAARSGSTDGVRTRQGRLHRDAALPADRPRDAQLRHRLDARRWRRPTARSRTRSPAPPTRRRASAPTTSSLAEVYDLSTALELDWYENIGLCKRGRGRGAAARRRHRRSAGASRSTRAAGWPASARRSPPRPSPRCASSRGSCAARPAAARSRARGRASPSTRACSATGRP